MAPEALAVTVEALKRFGNPGAAHVAGHSAAAQVSSAREKIAQLMRVGPAGVVFLGSATEANNLALKGLERSAERMDFVTTTTEHPSVLETMSGLTSLAGEKREVPVSKTGEVDLTALSEAVTPRTALVSIHAANNETGVVQPVSAVVDLARAVGALVHVDASQLMAWGDSSLLDDCDLVTVSSHKMHGPQGAAALIARPAARRLLRAQVTGGGQEYGLRSGTLNVAAIAGFGEAAALALDSGNRAAVGVRQLREELLAGLEEGIGDIVEHGAGSADRLPGILNVAIGTRCPDTLEAEVLLSRLPAIAASTGSACHSGTPEPSPVLLAMGVSEWEAARSVRLSLNRYSTKDEVEKAVTELARGYAEMRSLFSSSEIDERYKL